MARGLVCGPEEAGEEGGEVGGGGGGGGGAGGSRGCEKMIRGMLSLTERETEKRNDSVISIRKGGSKQSISISNFSLICKCKNGSSTTKI